MFNADKSTVLLGSPFLLATTTILAQWRVGVPMGTGSMMPMAMSRSRSALTLAFQWWGMGIGVWMACGTASAFSCIFIGGPDMVGRGSSVMLKADEANASMSHRSSRGMFASEAGNGRLSGRGGGRRRSAAGAPAVGASVVLGGVAATVSPEAAARAAPVWAAPAAGALLLGRVVWAAGGDSVAATGAPEAAARAATVGAAPAAGALLLGRVAWAAGGDGRGKCGGIMSRFLQHVRLRYVAGALRTM